MTDDLPTIQRVTAVDAALAAQLNTVFDDGKVWDAAHGRAFLRHPDTLLLVAWWDGRLSGFLTAYRLPRFDRRRAGVVLYEIVVHERLRRRGIGSALIAELKRWAHEVGADEVWVLTNTGNAAAMALYAATGAQEDDPGTTLFTYRLE